MPPQSRPKSLFDLFYSFTLISLQGFGGVVPIIQRELVEKKRWMTRQEFIEEWAIAQVLPGPNVINLSLIVGRRYFGWRGAFASMAGMLAVPMLVVLLLGVLYSQFSAHPNVAGAIRGIIAVAAGTIIATGIKLFMELKSHPLGTVMCATLSVICFVCVAILRWPLLGVIVIMGPLAWMATYRALKR